MSGYVYQDGALAVDGVRLDHIAEQVGTPVYCYAAAMIEAAFEGYRAALADLDPLICYAAKANANLAVLRTLVARGAGVDVVSAGELRRALAAGAAPDRIIFSGVGKTDGEIRAALNPLVFRSDNGPCYSSQEFKFFMQNWLVEHRTSSPHYPQSNGLAESMVKVSKNLIEKAIKQDLPWNRLLLDYRCTPISSEIPSPAEILFGRKFRSSISILPSQVLNDRISKQRELIAKKEGKFYASTQDFQDRIKALPFEAGQNVWLQDSDSRKFEEAVIREKCREPNSYMVEIPATGQCFRRNSNFIKPRQTDKNSVSTDPLPTTGLPEIPQEPSVLQQPSSQATSTVDAIPTVPSSKQNNSSTPRQPRTSRRSTKGIPPARLGLQE